MLLARASGFALDRLLASLADDDRAGVFGACEAARARVAAERAESARTRTLYHLERTLQAQGCMVVAGVDEVGRGALAGPLTAAAVVLRPRPRIEKLDDSKRLSPERREELALQIHSAALAVSIAHVEADEIDALGVTAALKRAITLALAGIVPAPDHVVIDGLPLGITDHETAVVKGDAKVAAIAAASIVAKVERDRLMREVSAQYPEFDFHINKGYGTREHMEMIARIGACPIHRRSFCAGSGTLSLF